MKKGLTFFAILLLAFGLVLAGCEGPASPSGDETPEEEEPTEETVTSHDFSTYEVGTTFDMVGSGTAEVVEEGGENVLMITVENYHT
ncbi:MAG: hypothetical protein ACOC0D_09640, partial [Spirochaeta sp.]